MRLDRRAPHAKSFGFCTFTSPASGFASLADQDFQVKQQLTLAILNTTINVFGLRVQLFLRRIRKHDLGGHR
jgi:hypothetical protein